MRACLCTRVLRTHGGHKRVSGPLELELQKVASRLTGTGIKPRSSGRAARALIPCTVSLTTTGIFFFLNLKFKNITGGVAIPLSQVASVHQGIKQCQPHAPCHGPRLFRHERLGPLHLWAKMSELVCPLITLCREFGYSQEKCKEGLTVLRSGRCSSQPVFGTGLWDTEEFAAASCIIPVEQ